MSDFCNDVKADKSAFAICEYIKDNFGVTEEDLDTGLPHVKHDSDGKSAELVWEEPNGKLEPAEVYKKAITLAEKEEDKNRQLLEEISNPHKNFQFQSPFHKFLMAEDVNVPWLFDDGNSDTVSDKVLFIEVNKAISELKEKVLNKVSGGSDSVEYHKALAKALYSYMIQTKSGGGLGIDFDIEKSGKEKNVVEIIEEGKARCPELTKLFMTLARNAGLEAQPVEIYTDADGKPTTHVTTAIILPDGEPLIFDIEKVVVVMSGGKTSAHDVPLTPSSGEGIGKWSFITKQDILAYDYSRKSGFHIDEDKARISEGKAPFSKRAKDFSPYNYIVLHAHGVYMGNNGNTKLALDYFLKTAEENPFFSLAHKNLYIAYKWFGMEEEAVESCNAYKSLTGSANCE